MKKMSLLLCLLLLSSPAFAGNVWYLNSPSSVVTSSITNPYTVTTKTGTKTTRSTNTVKTNTYTSKDSEALSALLAGAGLASGRIRLLATPSIMTPQSAVRTFLDPYIVNIEGKNYVLVKDSKDNKWTVDNILGSNDSRDDLFASLKALESDGDSSKITEKELKAANIRFVLLNDDESLELNDRTKDYDLSKVKYIDIKNLRTALGNKNQDGTFGYFYVIAKENLKAKAYPGRVTFEDKQELNKYIK